MLQFVAIAV